MSESWNVTKKEEKTKESYYTRLESLKKNQVVCVPSRSRVSGLIYLL